jgi:hypothetical protein
VDSHEGPGATFKLPCPQPLNPPQNEPWEPFTHEQYSASSIGRRADTDLARDTLARSPWPSQVRAFADGVFSTSWTGLDVARSFELGAHSYVSKPGNLHDFVSAVESISAFWFGCAHLLRKEDM